MWQQKNHSCISTYALIWCFLWCRKHWRRKFKTSLQIHYFFSLLIRSLCIGSHLSAHQILAQFCQLVLNPSGFSNTFHSKTHFPIISLSLMLSKDDSSRDSPIPCIANPKWDSSQQYIPLLRPSFTYHSHFHLPLWHNFQYLFSKVCYFYSLSLSASNTSCNWLKKTV